MRITPLAPLLLLLPMVSFAHTYNPPASAYTNAYANVASSGVQAAASRGQQEAKQAASRPQWMRQYPGGNAQDTATYEAQEQGIAHREAIQEREMEITHSAQIPQNSRARAILAHLKGLSKELNAAAKKREKDNVASQAQP